MPFFIFLLLAAVFIGVKIAVFPFRHITADFDVLSIPVLADYCIHNFQATACILSAAMMLRYSFGMVEEADAIENAVNKVLDKGLRTADNMSEGCTCLGCTAMGDAILAEI